jgi:hypothetical protein
LGIVAHSHSAKPALRWHDWEVEFDGMEWLNADTEWRDERGWPLARALARYAFRPAETLASLLDRPEASLARWDMLTARRPVVALAGADAHARLGWMDDDADGYRRRWFLRIPSYDASFRAFAIRVMLERPLSNDAPADAATIINAIRRGSVYSAVDAIAAPAGLEFFGSSGGRRIGQGGRIDWPAEPITLTARANGAAGEFVLRKDGRVLGRGPLPELTVDAAGEGTYRVEVYLTGSPGDPPIPWIVSNPIYIRRNGWETASPVTAEPEASREDHGTRKRMTRRPPTWRKKIIQPGP